jgi:fused signal recognition particle receptor
MNPEVLKLLLESTDLTNLSVVGVILVSALYLVSKRSKKELPSINDITPKEEIHEDSNFQNLVEDSKLNENSNLTVTKEIIAKEPEISDFNSHTEVSQPFAQVLQLDSDISDSVSKRLVKTRSGFLSGLKSLFGISEKISKETLEELRAILISSDVGVKTTEKLVNEVKESLQSGEEITWDSLTSKLKNRLYLELSTSEESKLELLTPGQEYPAIVLMVGVNGVGKTTSTAKLAAKFKDKGLSVLLVAADTFRAAAVEQLKTWGERLSVPVVYGEENCKPQTVVFDAMKQAKENNFDIILIDTAGRLNTKTSLMQELSGIKSAIEKNGFESDTEVLLVVDGTTGQNAVSQAIEFNQAAKLTGIIVTKLDGTAKGGVVIAVKNEINVPVRYIGVGESSKDLREFDAKEFVDALFDEEQKIMVETSAHGETRRRRRREAA